MRNRDTTHRKVSVHNGELVLCGRVFLGDFAFAKHDEYVEAAMPGSENSSSSKHWPDGQDENTERELVARTGHQLVASPEETKTESKGGAEAEQPPTSAGESGPEDQAADTDTGWEGDENETMPVRRVLRDEANSVAHYLLHRPGLPQHCKECRHAKTKRKTKFCRTYNEKCPDASYGDNTTCDHVNFRDVYKNKGVNGYAEGLTYLDRHSNFRMGQPVLTRDHTDTFEALQFMKGGDEWKRMYSDNEGSIKTACKALAVLWDPCQPGIHQSSGVIENINLQIVYDIKVTLCAAGFPACVWPYALAYVCVCCTTLLAGPTAKHRGPQSLAKTFRERRSHWGVVCSSCLHLQSTEARRLHLPCHMESSWGTAWHPDRDGINSTVWSTLMISLDILHMSTLLEMISG